MSKFLAGTLVGLVAGLLLAPDKGENTRENLMNTADKLKDRLNRLTGRSTTGIDELRDYLDQDIDGLTDDVRTRIHTILNEAEEMSYSPGASKSTMTNGVV
ncbi:MAG: YtxH domain-containing protein [Sphingobacteriales bacterium]|nr:MAG: YtxH domain-containing protein [Sphingobacteriales bacterium]